jgi:hypothetical protein
MAVKGEVLGYYSVHSPEKMRNFDFEFNKKLEVTDFYDLKGVRKYKQVMEARAAVLYAQFSENQDQSENLPKLKGTERTISHEGLRTPKATSMLDEDVIEEKYLNQARSEVKIGLKVFSTLRRRKPVHKQNRLSRFLSRESSSESDRMHELLSSFRQSSLQISRLKSREVSALQTLPQKQSLIPQSPSFFRRFLTRGEHTKSATASPSSTTPVYHVSIRS